MTENLPGSVFMTPDANRAIFLDPQTCLILETAIDQFLGEPTVAGPALDPAVLRELRTVLGESSPVNEDGPPTVLSQDLAIYLELICSQFFISAELTSKLQIECGVCGSEWIEDPGYLAQRQADLRKAKLTTNMINFIAVASLFKGHHRLLASLRGASAAISSQPNSALRCNKCKERDKLVRKHVVYCPNCHKLRTEAVLLQCPDCAFSFFDSYYSCDRFWTTAAAALSQFRVSWKKVAIAEKVSGLYKDALPSLVTTLVPGMVTGLVSDVANNLAFDISPDERLIGICRCGAIGNRRRDTAILLTSQQVVWAVSESTGYKRYSARWNEVREISGSADVSNDVWLKLRDGTTVVFSAFIGTGASMSTSDLSLGPSGIRRAMRQMLRSSGSLT